MSTAPHLHLVDPETGEIVDLTRCPHCEQAEALTEEITRKYKGALLQIRKLTADREGELLASPERPQVDALHALWKAACNRRRDLHMADRERMNRAVRSLGFRRCCEAIAGAAYDPNFSPPRRNGKRERFDDAELIFRETAKVHQFAERVPNGWQPNPDRIAEITGERPETIRKWLGEDA